MQQNSRGRRTTGCGGEEVSEDGCTTAASAKELMRRYQRNAVQTYLMMQREILGA